jgi:hypothetical protein
MGKIAFWLVVIFGVLFVLRMYNVAKARGRARDERDAGKPAAQMVQCSGCGVFLPAPEARATPDGYRCTDPKCAGNRKR